MKFNNFHKASAVLGVAAIAITSAFAVYTSPEQQAKNTVAIQECVQDFQSNLQDITSLHTLAKERANGYKKLEANLGTEAALDLAFSTDSHVSNGEAPRAHARSVEKTLLRNVGNLDLNADNPNDDTQLFQLCESSKVRENVKEARAMIVENKDIKTSLKKYNL